MEQITIAIPFHGKRSRWVMQTIQNSHNRQNVIEILICAEPNSDIEGIAPMLRTRYKKVRIVKNEMNLGPFLNKAKAVALSKSAWVALIDSDNIVGSQYLQFTVLQQLNPNIIYCPEMGVPKLQYGEYCGKDVGINEAAKMLDDSKFTMLINTGNYVVHRDTYLKAIQEIRNDTFNPAAVDVAWVNFHCLKAGMVLQVVRGCVYRHNVHSESTYLKMAKESAQKWEEIKIKIKECVNGNMASPEEVQAKKHSDLSKTPDWSGSGNGNRVQADGDKRPDQNGFDLLSN